MKAMGDAATRPDPPDSTDPHVGQAERRREFASKFGDLVRPWRGQISRHVKPLGLTFMQWTTLTQVSNIGEDVVQKDLASLVGIDGPTMVGVLDRLVEGEFVERRVAAHDRRANTVHLTEGGRRILRDADKELEALRDALLEGLTESELETCIRVFRLVAGRARQFESEPSGTPGP